MIIRTLFINSTCTHAQRSIVVKIFVSISIIYIVFTYSINREHHVNYISNNGCYASLNIRLCW